MVRKASELKGFREVQGITANDLAVMEMSFKDPNQMIYLLRTSPNLLDDDTKVASTFRKVYQYLYESGFIRSDLDLSFAYGKFLNELHGAPGLAIDGLAKFKSNREYERFKPIDDHKTMMFESIIRDVAKLNNFQTALVMKRYGLNGEDPKTLEELTRWSGKSFDLVENALKRAMVKLQKPEMKRFFRAAYFYDTSMDKALDKHS